MFSYSREQIIPRSEKRCNGEKQNFYPEAREVAEGWPSPDRRGIGASSGLNESAHGSGRRRRSEEGGERRPRNERVKAKSPS